METQNQNLDDLVFKGRNHAYGAYANRINYSRYMFWAVVVATCIFLSGISVPLIANYVNGVDGKIKIVNYVQDTLAVIVDNPEKIEIPPQKIEEPQRQAYRAPIVVSDTSDLTDDFSDLMALANNRNVNDTVSIGDTDIPDIKPPIIEIIKPPTYIIVEEMPEFPGGDAGRVKYLYANIKYPQFAREANIQGPVHVSFVVDPSGKVIETEVLRGIGGGCDEEALRVVANMPNWKPGRQSGQEVRVKFAMAINFRLE